MRVLLLSLSLLGSLSAQAGIFIVDARNGPGTHYTNIQDAVWAVPDGSTLLVRDGAYGGVTIDGKGLTILCAPNVTVNDPSSPRSLTIRNTQPGQVVTVRGLRQLTLGPEVAGALGPVTIDGAGQTAGVMPFTPNEPPCLVVTNSRQVAVRDWTLVGAGSRYAGSVAAGITNSVVLFESCTLQGGNALDLGKSVLVATPALRVDASQVHVVHTSVFGGNGTTYLFGRVRGEPGIVLNSSSLRVRGISGHQIAGGTSPPNLVQPPAVGGTGTAQVDPMVQLLGSPPTGPNIQLTRPTLSSLVSTTAALGGTLTTSRHGIPGVPLAVFLSLRAPSTSLPGLADPIWLDGGTLLLLWSGAAPNPGPLTLQLPVPGDPFLRGANLVWQAVEFGAGGAFVVTNPSPSFVR